MANERYQLYGFNAEGLGTEEIPIEPQSGLQITNGHILDRIMSGAMLNTDLVVNRGKRVTCPMQCLAPGFITDWTTYGYGGDPITGSMMIWNELLLNGNISTVYKKLHSAQGVMMPTSLTATKEQRAVLSLDIIPLWDAGVLFTETLVGAESFPVITEAYYLNKITVGGVDNAEVLDINVSWEWTIEQNEQTEPVGIFYTRRQQNGTATIKDLSAISLAQLEAGGVQTITATFTDESGAGSDIVINFSNCFVTATIDGDMATLTWEQVNHA
jgi:hypothetical protein|tara:strand:+ start:862 stop:1674 length:813 start_codon:yes stop_codon:yes gene_type:complete